MPSNPKHPTHTRGSTSVTAIEHAWRELRACIPGLPTVVVVLLTAGDRRRRRKRGHFAHSRWRAPGRERGHELAVSPELFALPDELLATLCHEAAHMLLWPEARAGVSSGGYYHRKDFRDKARELGLGCGFGGTRHGWNVTYWPDGAVPERFRSVLAVLERELPPGTRQQFAASMERTTKLPPRGLTRLACACVPSRAVYASKSVVQAQGVICEFCGKPFGPRLTPGSL